MSHACLSHVLRCSSFTTLRVANSIQGWKTQDADHLPGQLGQDPHWPVTDRIRDELEVDLQLKCDLTGKFTLRRDLNKQQIYVV